MAHISVLFVILCLALLVQTHIVWKYPTARSSSSGLKSYPCGDVGYSSTQAVTTLQGGKSVLISWDETIYHTGAPFRIALSYDDDNKFNNLILVDHLPHYDVTPIPTNTITYVYNITIPDINCPRCTLQLVNPMTDKESGCCTYPVANPQQASLCFSVYHSCANIVITGTTPVADWAAKYQYKGPCGPYMKQGVTWTQTGTATFSYNKNLALPANTCNGYNANCVISGNGTSPSTPTTSKKANHATIVKRMSWMALIALVALFLL